jgi:hypothetical protein
MSGGLGHIALPGDATARRAAGVNRARFNSEIAGVDKAQQRRRVVIYCQTGSPHAN